MSELAEKVVLITGAANGIGRATARRCSAAGAKVVLADAGWDRAGRSVGNDELFALAQELGENAYPVECDVTRADQVERLVASANERFGQLDGVVCSAGIVRDAPLGKLSGEDFREVLRVLVDGTFHVLQAASLALRRRGGSIVTTTGLAGFQGNYGQANFAAANAAVFALTRTASIELQRHGIRVNAVAPVAKTRMTEDLPLFEKVTSLSPEHVAPAHVFFLSDLSADKSGLVLAVAGAKLSTYRLVESAGRYKEAEAGVWTPSEIAEHWAGIAR